MAMLRKKSRAAGGGCRCKAFLQLYGMRPFHWKNLAQNHKLKGKQRIHHGGTQDTKVLNIPNLRALRTTLVDNLRGLRKFSGRQIPLDSDIPPAKAQSTPSSEPKDQ